MVGYSYRDKRMATTLKPTAIEFVTTTKIGEKGQLTVPKQFRKDLGLDTGAPFAVLRMGDGLILIPEQRRFEQLCRRVTSALAERGIEPSTLRDTLPQARQRVFARHYGTLASKRKARRTRKAPAAP
jgi:AbrB family looped-hinge helix DNA binding protein